MCLGSLVGIFLVFVGLFLDFPLIRLLVCFLNEINIRRGVGGEGGSNVRDCCNGESLCDRNLNKIRLTPIQTYGLTLRQFDEKLYTIK